MKILFITTAFNGMAQRLWIELDRLNHEVFVHIAAEQEAMLKVVKQYEPDLIVAPFLKTKIPAAIHENHPCLIVHPGIVGDRGSSSLDRALLRGEEHWGVTILQAVEKMDAGPVWSFQPFLMRDVSKAQLYRCEVTQAAAKGLLDSLQKIQGGQAPVPADLYPAEKKGRWYPKITQADLAFAWRDDAQSILLKIRAADSDPGVLAEIFGESYYCYGGHLEEKLKGTPGEVLAKRNGAVCIAVGDASVWVTHLRKRQEGAIKLPAVVALGDRADNLPESECLPLEKPEYATWQEIRIESDEQAGIAYLHFDFYNGAMSTDQCRRLLDAFRQIKAMPEVKCIVLMGGADLWSNGIHLHLIEQAENPADESWENILAIDDLILEIITSTDHYVISALQGNAGAGGVPLALAADKVLARDGIVLNPHTKNMGLYGSEYWTYLLPKRIGIEKAIRFTEDCLPWGVALAKEIGLIDDYHGETVEAFTAFARQQAQKVVSLPYFDKLIKAKKFQRMKDERHKPLAAYREEELEKMRKNFYENDQNYDYRRYCFVHKIPHASSDSRDLYSRRRKIYRRRKWESIEYNAS